MGARMSELRIRNANRIFTPSYVLTILLPVTFLAVCGCKAVEHRVIYRPDRYPKKWCEPAEFLTEETGNGVQLENACFPSRDGTMLHGWFVRPIKEAEANQAESAAVLFTHGRSGNISSLQPDLFEFVKRHQVPVFVFDYRGYGKSEGRPSESGLYDDARAARDWLAARVEIAPQQVVLMGRSLGAAVAVELAACDGARALVLENGFTSIPDMLQHFSGGILKGRCLEAKYDSINKIEKYTGPVFISHAKNDKIVPFEHGARLADAATSASSVRFVELEGNHHSRAHQAYNSTLNEFLKRH